jgi:tetratricopeptide (TPR) repeat protein
MRARVGVCLAGLLAIIALPALGGAYTAGALAQFQAGRQFQAAKAWGPAVHAYEAALKADPGLTASYKALGTVYYEAGDHKGALYFYDRYLATNPGDAATKNFADSIRASLGASAPVPVEAPAPTKKKRHWYWLWIA